MVSPRTMSGVLELLPAEQVTFQRMLDTIRRVYERFGFLPIETPAMELAEVLLTKTGGETERQVYFVQSTGSLEAGSEPELALRFDLTVPLARYVAEHEHDLAFPFRRYQMQRVYRGESPQRGRFREFYQCDVDVIDRDSLDLGHDAEMPAVMDGVFEALDIGSFTIRINDRKLMRGLLESAGVTDPAVQTLALREIDKLEKRGREAVEASLSSLGLASNAARRLIDLTDTATPTDDAAHEVLDRALTEGGDSQLLRDGASDVRRVLELVREQGVPEKRCSLDLTIVRGLDYYTGTVYETSLDDHPEIGSIASGGRYDDLARLYTSTRLPGVGISIGLTRLFYQLREAGLVHAAASPVAALVTAMDDGGVPYGMRVASLLRRAGINTEAAVAPSRLGRQLKYADRAGIRFAIIAGSDERDRGTVTVRDLRAQVQEEVAVDAVAGYVGARRDG